MAMAYPRQLTECAVCLERFSSTDPNHVPRSLFCRHDLCTECCAKCLYKGIIMSVIEITDTLILCLFCSPLIFFLYKYRCPQCKQKTKCANVNNIPKDFTLISFLDLPPPEPTSTTALNSSLSLLSPTGNGPAEEEEPVPNIWYEGKCENTDMCSGKWHSFYLFLFSQLLLNFSIIMFSKYK